MKTGPAVLLAIVAILLAATVGYLSFGRSTTPTPSFPTHADAFPTVDGAEVVHP